MIGEGEVKMPFCIFAMKQPGQGAKKKQFMLGTTFEILLIYTQILAM